MSKALGIVLAASAITFTNDWAQTDKPNFRILAAGLGAGAMFAGLEKINPQAAVGLATIAMITALLTPIHGKSAFESVNSLLGADIKPTPRPTKPPTNIPTPGRRAI